MSSLDGPISSALIRTYRTHFLRLELDYETLSTHHSAHRGFRAFEVPNWIDIDNECLNLYREMQVRERDNVNAGDLQKAQRQKLQDLLLRIQRQMTTLRFQLEGNHFPYIGPVSFELLGDPNSAILKVYEEDYHWTMGTAKFTRVIDERTDANRVQFRNDFYARYNTARSSTSTGMAPKGWWK